MKNHELMALVDDYAEQRHKQGHASYNIKTSEARSKVVSELAIACGKAEAYDIWMAKTEWMEGTYSPRELGSHKADVLKLRVMANSTDILDWAVGRWHAEVAGRPLVNVHRRTLDDTWRQIIRRFGGDDRAMLGPTHDELRAKENGSAD